MTDNQTPPTQQTEPIEQETSSQLAETLVNLQPMIERQIQMLDELKGQLRDQSERLKSMMDNDEELKMAEAEAKTVQTKAKERKSLIANSAEFREVRGKTVELKDEIKELEESLNSKLLAYYQATGVKTVDLSNGAQREFRIIAKVLSKKE